MRFQVIASGSNGNCSILQADAGTLIIDAGISRRRIMRGLKSLDIPPQEVIGILITHAHSDHISGLAVLHDHLKAPVIAPPETLQELRSIEYRDPRFGYVADKGIPLPLDQQIEFAGFALRSHPIFHDIAGSSGFSITDLKSQRKLSYATDTASITNSFLKDMRDSEVVLLESNHDEEMLWASRRPRWLKERIRNTHMSNKETMKFVPRIVTDKTRVLYLAHLSGQCNTGIKVAQKIHDHWQHNSEHETWDWVICPRTDSSSILTESGSEFSLNGGITSITNPDVLEKYPIEPPVNRVDSYFD